MRGTVGLNKSGARSHGLSLAFLFLLGAWGSVIGAEHGLEVTAEKVGTSSISIPSFAPQYGPDFPAILSAAIPNSKITGVRSMPPKKNEALAQDLLPSLHSLSKSVAVPLGRDIEELTDTASPTAANSLMEKWSAYLQARGVAHVIVSRSGFYQIFILPNDQTDLNRYAKDCWAKTNTLVAFGNQKYATFENEANVSYLGYQSVVSGEIGSDERYAEKNALERKNRPAEPPAEISQAWAPTRFSDPRHPVKDYRYLVHGISEVKQIMAQPGIEFKLTKRWYRGQEKRLEDFLQHPERVSNFPSLSASVIVPSEHRTISNSGFILKAPGANIAATCQHDMRSRVRRAPSPQERITFLYHQYGIAPPDEIIANTKPDLPHGWNEIIVRGTGTTGEKLEVEAAFVKTHDGKPLCSPERLKHLEQVAKRAKLPPIVYIEE